MDKPNLSSPIYDDRVNFVLNEQEEGSSREVIVAKLGLSNWKTIDMHMRRRNFVYDKSLQKYIPKTEPEPRKPITSVPTKIVKILSKFEQLGKEANPQSIAKEVGFVSAKEMGKYLEESGYYWNSEIFNYVPAELDNPDLCATFSGGVGTERSRECPSLGQSETFLESWGEGIGIEKFLPLLEFLDKNKMALQALLYQHSEGTIPKYAVPGTAKTKSIYMSDLVSMLVNEFCNDKNLSQREVVEAAIIEYMRKYGYEREVNLLLQKR